MLSEFYLNVMQPFVEFKVNRSMTEVLCITVCIASESHRYSTGQ